jgi:acetyl-CoA C-acetyltransferase
MGCVLPAGLKQCPARQTAIAAGMPVSAGAVTVNKACGSGMQAAIFGYDSIRAGTNRVVLAGGMESMSNAPHLLHGRPQRLPPGLQHCLRPHDDGRTRGRLQGRSHGQFCPGNRGCRGSDPGGHGRLRHRIPAPCQGGDRRRFPDGRDRAGDGQRHARAIPSSATTSSPTRPTSTRFPSLRPALPKTARSPPPTPASISDGGSALLLLMAASASAAPGPDGLMARMVAHARSQPRARGVHPRSRSAPCENC